LRGFQIDTLNVVPSILSFLCRVDVDGFDVSSLSTVLCGSSPLGKELISSFLTKFPGVQYLIQGYGMTEVVVLSHITPLGIIGERRLGSCGKLLPGFEAILRDENGRLINDPNCSGELYIKSPTVMRGYLNSENDQEPFDQDGWFRTGDILYYDDDGFFYVVDRVKDLIKVNGVQVAPSEIEDTILTLSYVKEVGVIGIDDPEHGQIPKAFIVLQEGEDEEHAKRNILELIKAKFSPVKQLRGGIEVRIELPKTSSGKVKRYALRQLYK
uniref:AMP-binding domain-containing protein n=1 Tax=Angiostrongylus costaricensis TaxID=334426 RepID=A0A0R3PG17_ANGCS